MNEILVFCLGAAVGGVIGVMAGFYLAVWGGMQLIKQAEESNKRTRNSAEKQATAAVDRLVEMTEKMKAAREPSPPKQRAVSFGPGWNSENFS